METSFLWAWIIIPTLIFLARVIDVTLGTLRLIFIAKGFRKLAPILGALEITLWLLAMRQIMVHLDNPMAFIAYVAGFSAGNYVGMYLEERISMGLVMLRIVFRSDPQDFMDYLADRNIGFTAVHARGNRGDVKILFSVVKRSKSAEIILKLNETNPKAFYTMEDVRTAESGIFPAPTPLRKRALISPRLAKSK